MSQTADNPTEETTRNNSIARYVAVGAAGLGAGALAAWVGLELGEFLKPENWYTAFGYGEVLQENPGGSSLDQLAGAIIPYATATVLGISAAVGTGAVMYRRLFNNSNTQPEQTEDSS